MKSIKIILLCCFLFTSLVSRAGDGTISLVLNGKSNYSIVIPGNAGTVENRAAVLLQDHIATISGCKLPMITQAQAGKPAIFIRVNNKITHPDGFTTKTKGNNIYIEGGSQKGCLYAVMNLLENYMGCRYYSSTYKVIPTVKNITLPQIAIADEPKNDSRIINISDKVEADFVDWNRLHTIDDFFAKGYYVHTFNRLVPWQDYFKSNPDYFSEMNGKRNIDQLCLSNPEVLQLVITRLEKDIADQPDKLYWSVSQNDNSSYCQCERCLKIISEEKSPSGPIIRFVNEVARHFPTKIISTLAYQYSRQAPAIVKPEDNVQVMLCTIELNRSKSIEEEKSSASFKKDIVEWGKICKHIYLWDYTIDFAHSISPFPNLHVLQPNIQFFNKNNVRAHFQQSNIAVGQEFSELKLYLISRLLWNPNIDVDATVTEFLKGYYGEAAPWIRKYIDQLEEELIKSGDGLDIYGHPVSHRNSFLSTASIRDYNAYFDNAEKAVEKDSAQLAHVKISRLPLQYAIMEIGKNDMFGTRGWYVEKDGDFKLDQNKAAMLENFYSICQQAGVYRLNESGLSPKEYYESSKRFTDVQVKGNYAFRKKVTTGTPPSGSYSSGDLVYLTNGVKGASDYKVHWLGWNGTDFSLVLDLEQPVEASSIEISSLWDAKSWILHPAAVSCLVSDNGKDFVPVGKVITEGNQEKSEVTRVFSFKAPTSSIRYVKFEVKGTIHLFDWHPSAGGDSWVFLDEIVVQ